MQFRDLNAQYRRLKPEIDAGIEDVIRSGAFILGKPVTELEEELADFVGRKYCVTCANGSESLQLVMMAWGIGPGDAVFTSDFTYIASASTISILGATPVFVDIDKRTFNMDADALDAAIESVKAEGRLTPRAVMPVDLFGQPADYARIEAVAQKHGLPILEDGAQGFGGRMGERRACSFGLAASTSFFPAKPLGCYGDGGAVFTDDAALAQKLRSLRAHGRSPVDKYDNQCIGLNSRLDTMQAAILRPKLRALAGWELDGVNHAAAEYTRRLAGYVVTPLVPDGFYSSWAQYTIMLKSAQERNALTQGLAERGIPSMVYYPRGMHQQTAYLSMGLADERFPNTVQAARRVLSLPMHPYLTEDDLATVAQAVVDSLHDTEYERR